MAGVFKTIFIIILVYYIYKVGVRLFAPLFNSGSTNSNSSQHTAQNRSSRKKTSIKEPNFSATEVEDADFEEIKED